MISEEKQPPSEGSQVIVGSRTHNRIRPNVAPIPLGHRDGKTTLALSRTEILFFSK